jgi:tetratricopeptide (TPR) repeat protein
MTGKRTQASDACPSRPGAVVASCRFHVAALMAACTLFAAAAYAALPSETDIKAGNCLTVRPVAGMPVGPCTDTLIKGQETVDPEAQKRREAIVEALAARKPQEALKRLELLRELTPFDPAIPFVAAMVLQDQGRHAEAIDSFGHALETFEARDIVLAQRSLSHAATKAFDKALADIDAALAAAPEDPGYKIYKGWIVIQRGQAEEGLAYYNAAVRSTPGLAWALMARAEALWGLGRMDQAIADAAEATAREPSYYGGYAMRAYLRMIKGDYAEALPDLDKALSLEPGDPRPLVARLYAHDMTGDAEGRDRDLAVLKEKFPTVFEAVQREFQKVVERQQAWATKYELAEQKLEAGDSKAALALIDELLRDEPDDRAPLVQMRARAAYMEGRYDEAAGNFQELMDLTGITYDMLNRRAWALWKAGRLDEALADASAAIERSAASPEYVETRARILIDAGQYITALKDIETLIAVGRSQRWAEGVRVVVLYRDVQLAKAGKRAVQYLRAWPSPDPAVHSIMRALLIDLQQGTTWKEADELLAVYAPLTPGDEFVYYLQARSAIRAGRIAEGVSHIERISSPELIIDIMADGVLRPVWNEPTLAPLFDPENARRRAFGKAMAAQHEKPGDLNTAVTAAMRLQRLGCPALALEQIRRLQAALDRYPGEDPVWLYNLMANISQDLGDLDGARTAFEQGLAVAGKSARAGSVRLNLAMFLAATGHPQAALDAMGSPSGLSPFGRMVAESIRAHAYDQLGDRPARDRAVESLAANVRDNPVQVVTTLGLLHSYELAADMTGRLMSEPPIGILLLATLHATPGAPAPTALDRRREALLAELRTDPRVVQAVERIGRMLTIPAPRSCPLGAAEQEATRITLPAAEAASAPQH